MARTKMNPSIAKPKTGEAIGEKSSEAIFKKTKPKNGAKKKPMKEKYDRISGNDIYAKKQNVSGKPKKK